ncbi:hypothetical protein [Streptomyces sp. 1331.2]|uniref:hypothetical protein n=1 Tax=Streptomyces sp. 1331.2 TaxID=1938835 RepID=UPI0015CF3EFA|nr:hypothetical protein [Streptomyces sp. 1331.2]
MTRAERVLDVPVSLPDVAELLDVVRSELRAVGRAAADAELRLDERGLLAVSYLVAPPG